MKKVTLKDIAKELNVSVATVSHVMNNLDDISDDTKKKVLKTAKKLGYISNNSAISLRSGKTYTIAIIIPDISNPHIAHLTKLIEDKMKSDKYSVIILNTNEDEEAEYNAITTACAKQVDGILLCPTQHSTKNIEFLNRLDIPYILIGRYFSDFDTDYVCADDFKGGYLAGKYLIEKGFRKPLYIGAYQYIESSKNRFSGLQDAFKKINLDISKNFIQTSPKPDNIKDIIEKLFKEKRNFDSIVAFSDLMAFEIISKVKNYSDNLPVIGFDAINSYFYMPFYNISIGMLNDDFTDKATSLLLKKINGSKEIYHEIIDVELFEFNA